MVCIPCYVHNVPHFIKSKMPVIIKITPIYVTSTKGKNLPVIMVCHILISEILKCEKIYLRINQTALTQNWNQEYSQESRIGVGRRIKGSEQLKYLFKVTCCRIRNIKRCWETQVPCTKSNNNQKEEETLKPPVKDEIVFKTCRNQAKFRIVK